MNMDSLKYWNHNAAYYPWIRKRLANCSSVLDVGCGDGSLAFYLDDGSKEIVGIDVDKDCISKAILTKSGDKIIADEKRKKFKEVGVIK